jgi:mutual gliding-motility protein MglA
MAFVNFATREITAKIVYYGPGLGGKTTSLQYIHGSLPSDNRGKMISLATEEDRTIYFDFLPLNLGKIQDFSVRVQLYTVPGQVRYNATRKLVLRGADGLVFVVDAQKHKKLANVESFSNLEENLREHGKDLHDLPHVLQINKIDLPNRMNTQELNQLLNKYNVPHFDSCATNGTGVLETLKSITKLVFNDLGRKALLQKKTKPATAPAAAATYPVDAAYRSSPSIATKPAPSYYGDEYSSDLQSHPVIHDFKETYLPPENTFPEVTPEPEEKLSEPEQEQEQEREPEAESPVDFRDSIDEVEPINEFDEVQPEEIPYEDLLPEESKTSELASKFSYSAMFEESEKFRDLMTHFEDEITGGNIVDGLITARAAYSFITTDLYPRDFVLDTSEALIMLALGVKFKRYLRFKQLLDSDEVSIQDLIFIHHFLCDLFFSLKES